MAPQRPVTSLGTLRWTARTEGLDPQLAAVLLDHITARFALIDRDQRYRYANREMTEFLGGAELTGRRVPDVIGEVAYESYRPLVERVWGGEAVRIEGWVDFEGLGPRYMVETFVPYAREAEGPIEVVAVFGRDHTELRRREQELAERLDELQASEALKTSIVDHALVALVSTDADGRVVEFNPAAEQMFGRERQAVLGQPVSDVIIPARHRAAHVAGMARMRAGEPPRVLRQRLELHALRADGSEFPIEMVLWRTDSRGSVFYTASVIDLQARDDAAREIERQREALRQSEKLSAMGSLLAGVAHELNNPLAIVMGRASLLEEKAAGYAELQADAARIREAAERCARIVRTFLDMARQRPTRRAPVSLGAVARSAGEMLQYGLRSHGIALTFAIPDDLPAVHADADQLGQVLMNLLVNAQQALASTPGERRVHVEAGVDAASPADARQVWLRVSDNGPGIAPEARPRLFEPFFTTKGEDAGTGLGLAVSRSLARDHGGELVLEPASVLGGARFCLRLPVGPAAVERRVAVAAAAPAAGANARVLVVDDEAEVAELLRDMLESAGHDVAIAESGAVGLELLAEARFDAIVSDLRMPDMDGPAFWQAVAARDPALARRMLFVTGDTLSPDARGFLARSGCASLDKPFARADLLARVRTLLTPT